MIIIPKARRHFHKAFLSWYANRQGEFQKPLCFGKRNDRWLEMSLLGLHPALNFELTTYGIELHVDYQDRFWDILISFDAAPQRLNDGYHCVMVMPKYRKTYPNRQALWSEEVFEPFLKWVNKTLLPSRWVGLYETECGGGTWAKLLPKPDPEAVHIFAVWPND